MPITGTRPASAPTEVDSSSPSLPKLKRTLRYTVRALWDYLGMVCTGSFLVFVSVALPMAGALKMLPGNVRLATLALLLCSLYVVIVSPLMAGVCLMCQRIVERDEPSLSQIGQGIRAMGARAVGLGVVHIAGATLVTANLVFYGALGGPAGLIGGAVFLYAGLFWLMNCIYHFPLLVACELRILHREDGGPSGLKAILRNGLLMTVSAPGFTFGLAVTIIVFGALLAASGVGLALVLPVGTALLATQATRDQFVRYGKLPPQPDLDTPVEADVWKLR